MPTHEPSDGPPSEDDLVREFAREADVLRSLADDPLLPAQAPPDLWDRITDAIERDERAIEPRADVPTADPDDQIGGAGTVQPLRDGRNLHSTRRRRILIASAAAAVVAIAIGVGVALTSRTTDPTTFATAELTPYDGAAVGDAGASVAVLGEGDQQKLRVDMHDLPAPAPGTFYELWLIDPTTGTPVSIATMTDGSPDVSTVVDLPAGTDTDRYDVVDVSVQDESAGPAHSGHSVLRGTLTT